jgi:hypothetical protein
MRNYTTITVSFEVRDALLRTGKMGQTYDSVLKELLKIGGNKERE